MSDLKQQFLDASNLAKSLPTKPDNDTLLELYAFYKQGSQGDVSGEKPGLFDFVAGAKYEAWKKLKGTDEATAQQRYIDLIKRLQTD